MNKKYIHSALVLKDRRSALRNNATLEEVILWEYIRTSKLGVKFQRQHSIGRYIVDFYCASKKIVIELDGNQHKNNQEYDLERTRYLEDLGLTVIRFWNVEIINNIEQVVIKIKSVIGPVA